MNEYAILALFTTFWCWGFHNAFKDGEVLGRPGNWIRNNMPPWWRDPMVECPVCMASVHGTIWFLIWEPQWAFLPWIMFIVAVSGFNYVIHILSEK